MGLLYEKERRTVRETSMPDVKEADSFKRSSGKVAPVRDNDLDDDWNEFDGTVEDHLAEGELDAEELDDDEL